MASKSQRAARDLKLKLALEPALNRDLDKILNKFTKAATASIKRTGRVPSAKVTRKPLEKALSDQYGRVQRAFSGRALKSITTKADEDQSTEEAIAAALLLWLTANSKENAADIVDIIDRNAVDVAESVRADLREDGPAQARDVAAGFAVAFRRRMRGIMKGQAVFNTQASAEATKGIEVEVETEFGPQQVKGPTRDWITVRDSKVRRAHKLAHGQRRELGKPFNVGGQKLRWPGDTQLGATPDNVMNCRCSAVYG